jgi:hypothetical protein
MKYLFAFVLALTNSATYACDNYQPVVYSSYCGSYSVIKPQQKVVQPQVAPQQIETQIPERIPAEEYNEQQPVLPERIDTPTTRTFKTKVNESLTLQVPSTMEIKSIVYVKVMVSSGELMTIPLVNNTFPVIKGHICTYSPNGVQYNENHYNTLVQRGYLQFGKPNLSKQLASK